MSLEKIREELESSGDPGGASILQKFFKTGPGEYGEGDVFRGIRLPVLRKLAVKYHDLSLPHVEQLLNSAFHEDRMLAVLMLVRRYQKGDEAARARIYRLYLKNRKFINNWDLIDVSAAHIVGAFLWDKDRGMIHRLAQSNNLWDRRIAIISTFYFIRRGEFEETLTVSRTLLLDTEDLIHKAVGWMLREVGNRSLQVEENFLRAHYKQMPRTMLRYAIEKFPDARRKQYLKGEV
ncbi:MAG TPA: DNA alkylation repair protein [Pyrinomonadaceae bacterium]|nr:DNA alkylation repair protein [Pyrinomonadaceae bacterium]